MTTVKKFDKDYHCNCRMPMVQEKLGDVLLKVEVDEGLGSGTLGSSASYVAKRYIYFESIEKSLNGFCTACR